MRIVVVSDTHGNTSRFEDVVFQQPYADLFLFLGDGEWDLDQIRSMVPHKQFMGVAGNCDFSHQLPYENEIVMSGKRIFFTHGHRYYVKSGLTMVIAAARNRQADILLFGHTHEAIVTYDDSLYIMNPGSLGHPRNSKATYGVIDITDAGIVTNIVEL